MQKPLFSELKIDLGLLGSIYGIIDREINRVQPGQIGVNCYMFLK